MDDHDRGLLEKHGAAVPEGMQTCPDCGHAPRVYVWRCAEPADMNRAPRVVCPACLEARAEAAEAGYDDLRRDLGKCHYILGFVEGSLQEAIDWSKLYENPTLELNCARDLELVKQVQASGIGYLEAYVIATAEKELANEREVALEDSSQSLRADGRRRCR